MALDPDHEDDAPLIAGAALARLTGTDGPLGAIVPRGTGQALTGRPERSEAAAR